MTSNSGCTLRLILTHTICYTPITFDDNDRLNRDSSAGTPTEIRCRTCCISGWRRSKPHTVLDRVGLRFHTERTEIRTPSNEFFCQFKRRTSSFSNCFDSLEPETGETVFKHLAGSMFQTPTDSRCRSPDLLDPQRRRLPSHPYERLVRARGRRV